MHRGVTIIGLRSGADGGLERYGRWLTEALRARGRLDAGGVRFGLRARAGGEVVRTGDGVSAVWVRACGRSRWRWRRHVARERAAIGAARRVVAISPMVAAELRAVYRRDDATVVLNPVFAPQVEPAPDSGGIVFVGHAFHRKGLDRLLAAVPALPRLPVHVIGRGRPRRVPGVRFHGPIEAAPWIAGARLLVHPARYEPYGNVVAEAVARGVPAVASDRTGAACLLDPTHVWREASGVEGLVATVERALADPQPPRRHPPSAEAHLDALERVLFD